MTVKELRAILDSLYVLDGCGDKPLDDFEVVIHDEYPSLAVTPTDVFTDLMENKVFIIG